MESEDLWCERVGTSCPNESTRIRWYRKNDPLHPENVKYKAERRDARIEARRLTHDDRMKARHELVQKLKAEGLKVRQDNQAKKKTARNVDFNTKLRLGLKLKLFVTDPIEYGDDMQYVLERVSDIPELERELMISNRLDRIWFCTALSQITCGNFHVTDGSYITRKLAARIQVDQPESVVVDECESNSHTIAEIPFNGISPAYEEHSNAPAKSVDLQVETIQEVDCGVHHQPPTIETSTHEAALPPEHESPSEADTPIRTAKQGSKLNVPVGRDQALHINYGVWNDIRREAWRRYPLPSMIAHVLQSSGHQQAAAEQFLRSSLSVLHPPWISRTSHTLLCIST